MCINKFYDNWLKILSQLKPILKCHNIDVLFNRISFIFFHDIGEKKKKKKEKILKWR